MKAVLDSSYLIKGEQTRLTLFLQSDVRPTTRPGIPVADHVTIQFLQEGLRVLQNRQRVYVYTYNIRSFQEGAHTIPEFSMQLGGTLIESVPVAKFCSAVETRVAAEIDVVGTQVAVADRVLGVDRHRSGENCDQNRQKSFAHLLPS